MNNLLKIYLHTRKKSEELCKNLSVEDYVPQSAEFASPPKWHLAHTTWFFEEMILKKMCDGYKEFSSDFSFLFNSYYNTIGERLKRSNRGLLTRPSVNKIYEYREYVDIYMTKLLKLDVSKEVQKLTILGINHEQQHQELTIADLKFTFSHNPIYPKYCEKPLVNDRNENEGWISIKEGSYKIGHSTKGFSFDNELGNHKVYLSAFHISKSLVTNGELLEFIQDNGYAKPVFWLDEGWAWIKSNHVTKPLYWQRRNNKWYQYTLAGLQEIEPDEILTHISFYEATAFAAWKGLRLPTEFEWEVASDYVKWGQRWEWTNSAYLPYPRFKTNNGAVGEYNGKFMVNQMVLRGSSVATSKNHSRKTYRNFFHPESQWQFSGIRLARCYE